MNRRKVTPEKLRDCADRGLTQAEAAAEMGCAISTLSRGASEHGVAFRRPPVTYATNKTSLTGEMLRDCIKRNMTLSAICKECECSHRTAHRVAKKNGLQLPTVGGRREKGRPAKDAPVIAAPQPVAPAPKRNTMLAKMWEYAARENKAMRERSFNK